MYWVLKLKFLFFILNYIAELSFTTNLFHHTEGFKVKILGSKGREARVLGTGLLLLNQYLGKLIFLSIII